MRRLLLTLGALVLAGVGYIAVDRNWLWSSAHEEHGDGGQDRAFESTRIETIIRTHYVFGGQTLAWWEETLNSLRGRTDEDGRRLYALARKRAEANLLAVEEQGPVVKVDPTPELLEQIDRRIGAP